MSVTITWTRTAMALPERVREELERRIRTIHRYFPEANSHIRVGITRSLEGLAFQSPEGHAKLMLEVRRRRSGGWRLPTCWTIAHELMHLAQFNSSGTPGGERACDIFALSRLPPRLIDESPSYLVVPRGARGGWTLRHAEIAHRLAREAVVRRSEGLRRYAQWWEEEFERRLRESRAH